MPIGGFVVTTLSQDSSCVAGQLNAMPAVEVYATDSRGNIITVIETTTSKIMEACVQEIEALPGVLSVGVAYLHAEDEIEKIEQGELAPEPPFKRKSFVG